MKSMAFGVIGGRRRFFDMQSGEMIYFLDISLLSFLIDNRAANILIFHFLIGIYIYLYDIGFLNHMLIYNNYILII